ncbi:MAG: potassium-transporting ATPase subunit KdpA, partial [Actinomycetota bacterium]
MGAVVFYIVLLVLLTPPLGAYMYRVYSRERIGAVEGVVYRLFGVNPNTEQTWRRYASSVLWLSAFSMVLLYILFRVQGSL